MTLCNNVNALQCGDHADLRLLDGTADPQAPGHVCNHGAHEVPQKGKNERVTRK